MLTKLLISEKINEIKALMPEDKIEIRKLSEYENTKIDWILDNLIPRGEITIVEGEGGVGKSTIVANFVAKFSVGAELPYSQSVLKPLKILIISSEEHPSSVMKPRFEKLKANLDNIFFWDGHFALDFEGRLLLKKAIIENGIDVIVIDPIVSFLGAKINMNSATDVRSVLGPLVAMIRDLNCAAIIIRHFNKGHLGIASHRGAGSVDFRNAARSVLQVIRGDGEDLFLGQEKNNLAPRQKIQRVKIGDGIVTWCEQLDISIEELHQRLAYRPTKNGRGDEAVSFLRKLLGDGPLPSREVELRAEESGISQRTLRRAKESLEIRASKVGDQWIVRLPDKDVQDGQIT